MINNHVDPDLVIKKLKKKPLIVIISLVVAILFTLVFIFGIVELIRNDEAAIAFLLGGLALSLTFYIVSFYNINKSRKNLSNIDFDVIRKELSGEVVAYPSYKTYFTKNYVISNYYYTFAIKYSDILWIYKDSNASFVTEANYSNLAICLKNGKKVYLYFLNEFSDEIIKHNSKVLVGSNSENRKKYNELLKEIK